MSRYTMVAQQTPRNYVVIKHGIPNVNSFVMGVRFRSGWAVVEKDSKIHHQLKKLPMLKSSVEHPITFLRSLPFITKPADVKMIYGADVFAKFVEAEMAAREAEALAKEISDEEAHVQNTDICQFRSEASGKLCKNHVQDHTVSTYCSTHILKDPNLELVDMRKNARMTDEQRKKAKKTAFNKLRDFVGATENEESTAEIEEVDSETSVQES